MKSKTASCYRRMKIRMALQLLLDGLPFLLLAFPVTLLFVYLDHEALQLPYWIDALAVGCMYCIIYGGGALLFLLGIWLRSRAKAAFECFPDCKIVSLILRTMSFIPAIISLGFLIGCICYSVI